MTESEFGVVGFAYVRLYKECPSSGVRGSCRRAGLPIGVRGGGPALGPYQIKERDFLPTERDPSTAYRLKPRLAYTAWPGLDSQAAAVSVRPLPQPPILFPFSLLPTTE